MATYFARKSGNVNAVDVWATTPSGAASDVFSSFTNADTLVANSFTVTVNVNTTVALVTNDAVSGATAGGTFSMASGVTLTANVTAGSAASAYAVTVNSVSGAKIVGNITGGSTTNAYGAYVTGTIGTLSITGNISGGTGATARGVHTVTANGTIAITGNVSGTVADGVYLQANVQATLTGTATGGSTGYGFNCTSVSQANALTVTGSAVGGTGVAGVSLGSGSTGSVYVTRAKGGSAAGSAVGVAVSTSISVPAYVEEIEFGDLGASPTSGAIALTDKTSNVAVMYRSGLGKKTLTDPNATGLMPAASNVRSGVIYNGGTNTGTCVIPAASSVVFGAAVDNTTGTAALTPSSLWNYLTISATTSGSIGERLKNCATIDSVSQSLSNALS